MDFKEYQDLAARTWVVGDDRPRLTKLSYLALGLTNEAGEVAGKLKKIIRDTDGEINVLTANAIADELGDVLWYLGMLARELGFSLEDIAAGNIAKLEDRNNRGVIKGSGDNR